MKNVIEIRPAQGVMSDIVLSTDYSVGEKRFFLPEVNRFIKTEVGLPNNQKPVHIVFNKNFEVLKYEYDADPALRTVKEKDAHIVVENFWKNHPLFLLNGQPHEGTKEPMFNLVESLKVENEKLKNFKQSLTIANIVNTMDYETKRQVSFYYNINPNGKTDEQLLVLLANFDDGQCISDSANFIKLWGTNMESDKDYHIVINKAVFYGVIQNRKLNGTDNYYIGENLIGTNYADVIAYCKREEQQYKEYICKRVEDADKFQEPKTPKAVKVAPKPAEVRTPANA